MDELEKFRQEKDEMLRGWQSPLTDEQKRLFSGLVYFSPNPELIIEKVKITPFTEKRVVELLTNTGEAQKYFRRGMITFKVGSTECELTVFENTDGQGLFLPFRDRTNGAETYSAGRYLEVIEENGEIKILNFNFAYNPYCAYNDRWRCPLTPPENNLPVEIRAGEKMFH